MKVKNLFLLILMILMVSLLLVSCAQEGQKDKLSESPDTQTFKMNLKGKKKMPAPSEEKTKREVKEGLKSHFIVPFEKAGGRYLEYKVNLTYECKDLLKSRQILLKILSSYGFIRHSYATTEGEDINMNAEIHVPAGSLYKILVDLDQLGILLTEEITVIDYTEQMVLEEIKIKREQVRLRRKNEAMKDVTGTSKTWKDIDSSLERSEDGLDSSKFEQWKIQDRVSWAKIYLYLKGPSKPSKVKVPTYQNAFIGALNIILGILYILIYLLPFVIIFILIWIFRGNIVSLFLKRKKKK